MFTHSFQSDSFTHSQIKQIKLLDVLLSDFGVWYNYYDNTKNIKAQDYRKFLFN